MFQVLGPAVARGFLVKIHRGVGLAEPSQSPLCLPAPGTVPRDPFEGILFRVPLKCKGSFLGIKSRTPSKKVPYPNPETHSPNWPMQEPTPNDVRRTCPSSHGVYVAHPYRHNDATATCNKREPKHPSQNPSLSKAQRTSQPSARS